MTPKPQVMFIARMDPGPETRMQWARIGRVSFSKTGRTLYYDERTLRGSSPWYFDVDTDEKGQKYLNPFIYLYGERQNGATWRATLDVLKFATQYAQTVKHF